LCAERERLDSGRAEGACRKGDNVIRTTGVYHLGIPVDDLDRAEQFYSELLGMKKLKRIGGDEEGALGSRLLCGNVEVVLFQRPTPLNGKSQERDGITHTAFEVAPEDFDNAVEFLKSKGLYVHGPEIRPSGRGVYFLDSEGNYQQLHTYP
jgi:glyoxylase I family protein